MNNRLNFLLRLYINRTTTEPEERELFEIIKDTDNEEIGSILEGLLEVQEPVVDLQRRERIFGEILRATSYNVQDHGSTGASTALGIERPPSTPLRVVWRRVAAAAAILVFLTVGGYFIFKNKENQEIVKLEPQEKRFKNDIAAPTKQKATITLADGSTVALDSLSKGTLARQGDVNLTKTADGKIIYTGTSAAMVFNTLTNPKGSKVIDMTLADGSHIWLNAGSSVSYPITFKGDQRKIFVTGEAYLEVKHDAAKPFIVNANNKGEIEVMGTHFNVNAYEDEDGVRTTLLEGKVKVTRTMLSVQMKDFKILSPGQQAVITKTDVRSVNDVDVDQVMAWKNGLFKFKEVTIETIMRQVEKWYDVDVVFEGTVSEHFITTMPRDVPVSQVFKYLEATGRVRFRIEGRRVTVMP